MAWPTNSAPRRDVAVFRPFGRLATKTPSVPLSPAIAPRVFAPWGVEAGIGEEPAPEEPTAEENMFELKEGKWVPVIGAEGDAGAEGLQGQWYWTFDTTKATEPVAGDMTANTNVPGTINSLRFSATDGFGGAIGPVLAAVPKGALVTIRSRSVPSRVVIFKAAAAMVEKSGTAYTLEVELLHDGFGTLAIDTDVAVTFSY